MEWLKGGVMLTGGLANMTRTARSEPRASLQKLKSMALLACKYRRRYFVPSISALHKLHVDAMDLLLRIGPSVSKIRDQLKVIRLANYASQRERLARKYIQVRSDA